MRERWLDWPDLGPFPDRDSAKAAWTEDLEKRIAEVRAKIRDQGAEDSAVAQRRGAADMKPFAVRRRSLEAFS